MKSPSLLDTPEFQNLIGAFNKFAAAHSNDNVSDRALRSVLAGTKATVDQALVEFPKSYISGTVQDVYTLVLSQEVADGVSATVRSLDAAKIKELVEGLKLQAQDPKNSLAIAKQVKGFLAKTSNADLISMLDKLNLGMQQQMMAEMIFSAVAAPVLDQARGSSEAEVAEQIRQLADAIPSDDIATKLGAATASVTPAAVSNVAHQLVDSLPSPTAIADTIHAVGNAASAALGDAVKSTTSAQSFDILQKFAENAVSIVTKTLAMDKKPAKKILHFDF